MDHFYILITNKVATAKSHELSNGEQACREKKVEFHNMTSFSIFDTVMKLLRS